MPGIIRVLSVVMTSGSSQDNSRSAVGNLAVEQRPAPKPDIRALMAEIRAKLRSDIENNRDKQPDLKTYDAHPNQQASVRAGDLFYSEELRFMNLNHDYASKLRLDGITSHRRGVIGRMLVKAKQKFVRMLRYSLLKEYFASEAEFHLNLVKYLNGVSNYVDARDGSIFWELIRKIDYDLTKAMQRIEQIGDEQMAGLRSSEKDLNERFYGELRELNARVSALQAQAESNSSELRSLDSVARGLEGIVASVSASTATAQQPRSEAKEQSDFRYLMLENRFRGSAETIKERLSIYPEIFRGAVLPILEIGSGRGELQELFREKGTASYSVDTDTGMVETCRKKGLDVRLEDGLSHLSGCADSSLGGIIAIQVVEHLPFAALQELFKLCAAKVARGGRIIFETINPQSMLALSSNYFRDPTHVWPLHPDTLSYAMTQAGLDVKEVRYLSPVPKEAQLKEIAVPEYATPRWADTLKLLNHNLSQLNALLYGYQDYAVIAESR